MSHLRYLTAGESHGQALVGILDGIPAGLRVSLREIHEQLCRRQQGHGRGRRMQIEHDEAQILSGVRFGKTLGSPIAVVIWNRDWQNWKGKMDLWTEPDALRPVTVPRPGHADLAGAIKYGHTDIRNVLERASARETAIRVALGSIARQLLDQFGIRIASHVLRIGDVESRFELPKQADLAAVNQRADESPVRVLDSEAEKEMIQRIDEAKADKDTLGGVFEVLADQLPVGLGSHVHWDKKLDGRISQAMMSIQGIKGVEIGLGFRVAAVKGSEAHDEIFYKKQRGFYRVTDRAGGVEGGMTNGERLVVRAAMKPLSTLMRPLNSVDLITKEPVKAHIERSDVCAVPAASVIGEAVLALGLADALLVKFGGDSMNEMKRRFCTEREISNV